MLGIGLHSYGFMESAVFWLGAFMLVQLLLIAIGCLPLQMWRSLQVPTPAATPRTPANKSPGRGKPKLAEKIVKPA
jgi:hypothetical protein